MENNIKLEVKDLTVSFKTTQGFVRAVRGVSFDLKEEETLAIVGESGSGKSVTSRTIMGILAGNGVVDKGNIIYEGQDLTKISEEHLHEIRGNKIGMIFQDPMSSLNPIMRIGQQITEGMMLNGKRLHNKYLQLFQLEKNKANTAKIAIKELKVDFRASKKVAKSEGTTVDTVAFNEKLLKLKEEFVAAKALCKVKKAEAKVIVTKDWKDEKARVQLLIDDIKVKAKDSELKEKKAYYLEIEELRENLRRFKKMTKKEAYEAAIKVMNEVAIPEPEKRFKQYPFQFSGGMRQRIVIAITLTLNPDVLICDEPTTALDVTIQAQILELINRIKAERKISVIFITHDLGVVANMADRIGVMYAGKLVEIGTAEDIFYGPRHPYTWALLSSMPDLTSKERLSSIPGTPPNMLFPPVGDAFADRNKFAMKIDFEQQPPMFKISDTHFAATWLLHPDAPKVDIPKIITDRIERMASGEIEVSK